MFELNSKHIGSFVFIRNLGRKFEVCEKNKHIFIEQGIEHVVQWKDKPKAKATKKTTVKKDKEDDSSGKE